MFPKLGEVISMPANKNVSAALSTQKISSKEARHSIRQLFWYSLHYYPLEFWLSLFCIIISSLAGVLPMVFLGVVIDQINSILAGSLSSNAGLALIGNEILIVSLVVVVGMVASYLYNYLEARLAQGVQKRIRDDLFDRMQDLPLSYFDTRTHGDLMSIYTNDVDALREALSRSWPMILSGLITMAIIIGTMFYRNWLLACIVIILTVPVVFLSLYISKMSGRYFLYTQAALAKTDGYVEELVSGQKVVKVFNYEKRAEESFDPINDDLRLQSMKANQFGNIVMPIANQMANIQYVILALVGAFLIFNSASLPWYLSSLTVGSLVSFLVLSKIFAQPMGQVAQQVNSIDTALAGSSRIFALIGQPQESDDGYVELCNAISDKDGNPTEVAQRTNQWAWKHPHKDGAPTTYVWLKGKIDFFDVDFAYVPGKLILHNITLTAKPGQKIAFVGPTGAGKTTITNLINRFYDIEDGKIRFDDININKIKKADLRRSLGMVLQDTNLFTGSIWDNIRFGKLDATDEEVVNAAKLANADGFITQLPQGYDTILEKAGNNLSQGQKQLISIARVAVANPPVMILDEATSSIDSRTEKLVQEGMDAIMKGRTVFVIAHRLSTVKNADVIMVIDAGRIIESGSHDELMARKGKYYQLYTGNAIEES